MIKRNWLDASTPIIFKRMSDLNFKTSFCFNILCFSISIEPLMQTRSVVFSSEELSEMDFVFI